MTTPNSSFSFNQKCYALLQKVPQGKVTTYKEIAKALKTKAYRAVGNAMSKNEKLIVIPCHRVINRLPVVKCRTLFK